MTDDIIVFVKSYFHISFNQYVHCSSGDLLIVDVRGWVTKYLLLLFDIF